MFCDIDQVTVLNAAIKLYGPGTQIGNFVYLDTLNDSITIYVTPHHARSIKASFYYKKGSFDPKDKDLDPQ